MPKDCMVPKATTTWPVMVRGVELAEWLAEARAQRRSGELGYPCCSRGETREPPRQTAD